MELFLRSCNQLQRRTQILVKHLSWRFLQKQSQTKSRSLSVQKPLSWMSGKVLNMLLTWVPKSKMFHSQKRQRLIAFMLVNTIQYARTLKNNIYHSKKRAPSPFVNSQTNPVFGQVMIHSFDKTHVLVVTVELIWLLLFNILSSTLFQNRTTFCQVHKIEKKL